MNKEIGKTVALGAAAGAAGTALLRGMIMGTQRFAPQMLPPIKKDPGEFMIKQAKNVLPRKIRRKIPEPVEITAATALAFGYGMTFGSGYGALRPRGGNILLEGAALVTVTWAAGYLGWLPATKLSPPVWKHRPKQTISNILSHVVFGIATVALFKWAREKLL